MTRAHHLVAHWVDDDEDSAATPHHHHLEEHWVFEDEVPPNPTVLGSDLNVSS
jgi:hypothetical protein